MTQKRSALQEFKELAEGKDIILDSVKVNGHFVNFTSPETDNMWLGFCLAKGIYDSALSRSSKESIGKLLNSDPENDDQ